ncbi:MAG: ABC transporter permease [Bifidobacteriaceae bacterium]|jgi:ABC-2 type transport system permease protein|nr:ABC transporter permease [Bifidobacteriaceae bacterium]
MNAFSVIFKHEFWKRITSRVFIITTAIYVVLIVGGMNIVNFLMNNYLADTAQDASGASGAGMPAPSPDCTQEVMQMQTAQSAGDAGLGGMDSPAYFVALAVAVFVFMMIYMNGMPIATGVVEEKSGRVVEILLACVKPWQLMTGKILGIGATALIQAGAIIASVIVGIYTTGAGEMLNSFGLDIVPTVILGFLWFLVGFFTYVVFFAALASTVSRPEELNSAMTPITLFTIIPFYLGIYLLPFQPDAIYVKIMEYVPLFSPFIMPNAYALGSATLLENIISLAISIAALPFFFMLAAKIYEVSVLHSGSRLKLRKVFGEIRK